MTPEQLSAAQARRIAIAAQGLAGPRTQAPGIRRLRTTAERLAVLQIDSVNVFERAHYLPAYSRHGAYDRAALDRLTYGRHGRMIEYWAHQAAFVPRENWPLFEFRRAAYRAEVAAEDHWLARHDALRRWVLADLAANGPQRASELEHDAAKGRGGWWGWSDAKRVLEWMFRTGEVVCVERRRFERVYALPEQVLPGELVGAGVAADEAVPRLVGLAARSLGVASEADLADYWRMGRAPVRAAIRRLEEAGELIPVEVEGWKNGAGTVVPAWLHRDAARPRRVRAAALLSPFDPLVWFRPRTERLFGFHYRIEIYTPAEQRVYGYYTLPVLLDDRVVGRIDLKSDRKAGVLRVQSAWQEPGAPVGLAERIAPEILRAAEWQGLAGVELAGRGDLSPALAGALRG
ncbi:winged helix-turn-helix domain-containing protein [Agromyces archimandritae]|uniref:YcaQ family DNA glycosylase n=1 Tax=Agromyces archimandritae TaxID=2781962 RepID=A0A975FME7_9MICO|nr:crosslink repair DNA glycosylase YcaQ family protein [Agromyces archimandritae]QTX04168.1 YcaQ family DNA glycosylase [Agromyces archimandritae]